MNNKGNVVPTILVLLLVLSIVVFAAWFFHASYYKSTQQQIQQTAEIADSSNISQKKMKTSVALDSTSTLDNSVAEESPTLVENDFSLVAIDNYEDLTWVYGYKQYMLTLFPGWEVNVYSLSDEEKTITTEVKITNSKDSDYVLFFNMQPSSGGVCFYEGESWEGPGMKFDSFVDLQDSLGNKLRRSLRNSDAVSIFDASNREFEVCEYTNIPTETYIMPTEHYSAVSVTTPYEYDSELLSEIDSMIESLEYSVIQK